MSGEQVTPAEGKGASQCESAPQADARHFDERSA